MIVKINSIPSDLYLEISEYIPKSSGGETTKRLKIHNIKDGKLSKGFSYVPLEDIPEFMRAITQLLIEDKS